MKKIFLLLAIATLVFPQKSYAQFCDLTKGNAECTSPMTCERITGDPYGPTTGRCQNLTGGPPASAPCATTTLGGYTISQPDNLNCKFAQPGALGFAVARIFTFVLPIVGIIGFLFVLWSGIQYLTSKGDPKALAGAQARLTYTVIGLIIVALAYTLTAYVTGLFGIVGP